MMRLLVSVQIALLVKPFIAVRVWATERLFARVDSQMGFQVEIETKLFITNLALIRFLSSVHKHVSLQLGVVQKSFVAKFERALEL